MAVARLILVAACALIDREGRLLIAQRPAGKAMAGLWEFPGGKMEPGERPEDTVIREMREELGVEITARTLSAFVFASHAYSDFHLLMPLYLCREWQGQIVPRERQRIAWVNPDELENYPMPPADLPLIPLLRRMLG